MSLSQSSVSPAALATACASWIDSNLSNFSLPPLHDPGLVHLLKPIGELAIVADTVSYWSPSGSYLHRWAELTLSFCWSELREGRLFEAVLLRNPDMLVSAWLYASFARNGRRSGELEAAFRRLVGTRAIRSSDLPAWRLLEAAVALSELGIEHPWRAPELLDRTWVVARPEPWSICLRDAYAMTHTIFYATKFGREPVGTPEVQSSVREYLECWLPVWLEFYWHEGNLDIVSELIISARCLNLAVDDACWLRAIRAEQRSDGMVRGPTLQGWGLSIADSMPGKREFVDNYHTTLVAMMAATMTIPA